MLNTAFGIESIGARPIPEFYGVHDVWPRGDRLEAVRAAAAAYKPRFKQQGEVLAVKSVNIAAAPYPVKFAFHGAAIAPAVPYISIINRMVVVQFRDWSDNVRVLGWEPTVPEGSNEARSTTRTSSGSAASRAGSGWRTTSSPSTTTRSTTC